MFERNMTTHVSMQHETSALCKNNLSNYGERLLPFLSGMLYSIRTPRLIPPTYVHPLYIFRCSHILPLIMWFQKIDWNCSLSFIKMDCSVNILWLASVSSPRCIWLSIPQQKLCLMLPWECMATAVSIIHLTASKRRIYFCKLAPV